MGRVRRRQPLLPDERYVRLGSGLDAADAAPIRGVALGTGSEDMDVSVRVEEMAQ